ncbi:hypothetical protein ACIBQ1_09235 [Nonomuraea sp. NPDC050153]|uniref:hypothetical protein n=1 Tax=Nonomuraea sp. NPDC050153 TaxID=3364359 RepID=UPI0037972D99
MPKRISRPVPEQELRPKHAKVNKRHHKRHKHHASRKHRRVHRAPCARFEGFKARLCRTLFQRH